VLVTLRVYHDYHGNNVNIDYNICILNVDFHFLWCLETSMLKCHASLKLILGLYSYFTPFRESSFKVLYVYLFPGFKI